MGGHKCLDPLQFIRKWAIEITPTLALPLQGGGDKIFLIRYLGVHAAHVAMHMIRWVLLRQLCDQNFCGEQQARHTGRIL